MRIKDARQTFLGIWLRRVIEGEPFEVWAGEQRRDLLYDEDAAEAFLLAAVTEEVATVAVIERTGAILVLIDVDPGTYTMAPPMRTACV
jgi:nucleoside-diphosphate-sugar epimerase